MQGKIQRRDVIVIGAGFCGTALAAALKHYGVESFSVLEKGDGVGAFWQNTYDRLRLHSPWHRLPHDGDIDTAYPAFKTRDDVVQYFRDYVALHAIEAWFQFGETVTRVKYLTEGAPEYRQDPEYRWYVASTSGTYLSKFVAICTSICRFRLSLCFRAKMPIRAHSCIVPRFKTEDRFKTRRSSSLGVETLPAILPWTCSSPW